MNLVEMASRLPEYDLLAWMYRGPVDNREVIAELHRENPGTDRADELEILAMGSGWLY